MNEAVNEFLKRVEQESQGRAQTLERLLSAADASKVFGQPVTSGEYTVITAAEVASGGGFGSGIGFGLPKARRTSALTEQGSGQEGPSAELSSEGAGGGGGGGGGSAARPVAVIVIGPQGVEVRPIVDVRRVGLAAVAALAVTAPLWLRMARKR